MTTLDIPRPTGATDVPTADRGDPLGSGPEPYRSRFTGRQTARGAARSELVKFRTATSNRWALGGAAMAAIGFGALFSSLAGSDEGPRTLVNDALSLSLAGFQVSQLVIAILGVSLVAGEYQNGMIRTWFGAVPRRLRVLWAKSGVFGMGVFVSMTVAAAAAFQVGQWVYPDQGLALSFLDDGVLQAIVGTGFSMAVIGLIGISLGFILRSTAAGAGAVAGLLMLAPVLVGLLPDGIADPISQILPSNAAAAVAGTQTSTELLSAGWGLAVLIGWVVVGLGAAALTLRRRDA